MKTKILFILILLLSIGRVFTQDYFNHRFFYVNHVTTDVGSNALEIYDGYVVNGVTTGLFPGKRSIAMAKYSFSGELLWKKAWGDSVFNWYANMNGTFISHLGYYWTINGKRSSSLREMMILKYNQDIDTIKSISLKPVELPFDSTYITRSFAGIENGFAIVGCLEVIHDLKKPINISSTKDLTVGLLCSTEKDKWYSTHDLFLLKIDTAGHEQWEKVFSDSTRRGQAFSVIQTPDGGYAIGAHKWYSGMYGVTYGDPIVIKTDSLGNKEWEVNLGTSWPDGTAIVCNSIDSNIVVAASVAVDSGYNHYYSRVQISKLDLQGNILWNNLYAPKGLSDAFWVSNIRQDSAGGFIISGSTNYSEVWPDEPNGMGYMLRINNDGDSLWYRQYANLWGKFSHNYFYDAIPTSDGGFLGAGMLLPSDQSGDTGNQDAWIIKVDSMGCTSLTDCWVGVPEWKWITTESGNKIKVYPNPARNYFEVKVETEVEGGSSDNITIEIFDLFGRKVEETEIPKGKNSFMFYVSDWNRGIYLVRVKSGSEVLGSVKVVLK